MSQFPPFLLLNYMYLLQQLNPNSTWGKIGNPLATMKSVALLKETINIQNNTPEESSNVSPMFLTANPKSCFNIEKNFSAS